MNMLEWIALAAVAAAAVCGVRYFILRVRKRDKGCKGCPYAEKCGRECDEDGKKT